MEGKILFVLVHIPGSSLNGNELLFVFVLVENHYLLFCMSFFSPLEKFAEARVGGK